MRVSERSQRVALLQSEMALEFLRRVNAEGFTVAESLQTLARIQDNIVNEAVRRERREADDDE